MTRKFPNLCQNYPVSFPQNVLTFSKRLPILSYKHDGKESRLLPWPPSFGATNTAGKYCDVLLKYLVCHISTVGKYSVCENYPVLSPQARLKMSWCLLKNTRFHPTNRSFNFFVLLNVSVFCLAAVSLWVSCHHPLFCCVKKVSSYTRIVGTLTWYVWNPHIDHICCLQRCTHTFLWPLLVPGWKVAVSFFMSIGLFWQLKVWIVWLISETPENQEECILSSEWNEIWKAVFISPQSKYPEGWERIHNPNNS